MILIGIGANLPSPRHGQPRETCEAALDAMAGAGIGITGRSRWYRSAPVPEPSQPWYVNGVAHVKTALTPAPLMAALRGIETDFGRTRGQANEARILDLDILAYGDIKRVELAVALANRPKLLLMDEPTAGMAPRERVELMALTAEIVRERNICVLFTEHDMDVVFAHADRIMVLDRGRLIAQGPPKEVRADKQVQEIYLGSGAAHGVETS